MRSNKKRLLAGRHLKDTHRFFHRNVTPAERFHTVRDPIIEDTRRNAGVR